MKKNYDVVFGNRDKGLETLIESQAKTLAKQSSKHNEHNEKAKIKTLGGKSKNIKRRNK